MFSEYDEDDFKVFMLALTMQFKLHDELNSMYVSKANFVMYNI